MAKEEGGSRGVDLLSWMLSGLAIAAVVGAAVWVILSL
jgi:hypothetical protein